MSMSFLLSFSWDRCCGTFLFFLINASVLLLPSLSLVYTRIVLVGNTPSNSGKFSSSWKER